MDFDHSLGCNMLQPERVIGSLIAFFSLATQAGKAAGYAVPTTTAPLRGLLHCLACVAKLKKENNDPMALSDGHY